VGRPSALHAWTPAGKVACGSDFVGPILLDQRPKVGGHNGLDDARFG